MHRALLFAGLSTVLALTQAPAAAQPSPTPPAGPWGADVLPPALPWTGASERLVAPSGSAWITPAETSGFQRTATYAEIRSFLARLDSASPLIRVEVIGRSSEGREIVAVTAGRGRGRPAVLAQAGIHAGEIDGADAALMLLRDIATGGRGDLVADVDLVVVPVFNVDGHARSNVFSRPNQRGPELQGWRTTAQNLNLNRDYAKLDAPEMRAMLALIRRLDPLLYVDLHVTDGIDYQYDITWGSNGSGGGFAYSPAIADWMNTTFNPAATEALRAAGHIPGPLVFAVDDREPERALFEGPTGARLSHGYGDAAHIPSILVENHSLKPYRQRVLGTYVLLEAALRTVTRNAASLRAARDADRRARPATLAAAFAPETTPSGTRPFLPVAHERFTSTVTGQSEIRWLGRPAPEVQVPLIVSRPSTTVTRPTAYWVPVAATAVIERLRLHGLSMETVTEPRLRQVEMLRAVAPTLATAASEGRVGVRAEGFTRETRGEAFAAGSVRVPTDQPLGDLAVLLLEPESAESLFAWGFFPGMLQRTEYAEGYVIAPLAERMLDVNPRLRAEFEARLAADPAFAADRQARLSWFYARTPYYDDRYLLYPVGRELAP